MAGLQDYREFKLDRTLTAEDFMIEHQSGISNDLTEFIKACLVTGFKQEKTLIGVSLFMLTHLPQLKEGSSWLCTINPEQIETGLAYHCERDIHISFINKDKRYFITLAQTL